MLSRRCPSGAKLFCLLLLFCVCWAWASSRTGILVVFDSKSSSSCLLHKGLVELLKQKRAEGHFAGADVDQSFYVYNMAEAAHVQTLKRMGVGKTSRPFICLTVLDSAQRPTKITWRSYYDSPEEALKALDEQLGIAVIEPPPPPPSDPYPSPSPSYSPPAYPPPDYPSPSPSATPRPKVSDRLLGGGSLTMKGYLESPNHEYQFVFQDDGNCVVQHWWPGGKIEPIWNTATRAVDCQLVLTRRGKLMLVNGSHEPVWEAGEDGPEGDYFLQMQNDGNLVIYRRHDKGPFDCCWASKREGAKAHPPD